MFWCWCQLPALLHLSSLGFFSRNSCNTSVTAVTPEGSFNPLFKAIPYSVPCVRKRVTMQVLSCMTSRKRVTIHVLSCMTSQETCHYASTELYDIQETCDYTRTELYDIQERCHYASTELYDIQEKCHYTRTELYDIPGRTDSGAGSLRQFALLKMLVPTSAFGDKCFSPLPNGQLVMHFLKLETSMEPPVTC